MSDANNGKNDADLKVNVDLREVIGATMAHFVKVSMSPKDVAAEYAVSRKLILKQDA